MKATAAAYATTAAQVIRTTTVEALTAALPVVTNPAFTQNTIDFATSVTSGSSPTPSVLGFIGAMINQFLPPEEELR